MKWLSFRRHSARPRAAIAVCLCGRGIVGTWLVVGCSANMTAIRPAVVRLLDADVTVRQLPQSVSFVVTAVIWNPSRTYAIRRTGGTRVEKRAGTRWRTAHAKICESASSAGTESIAPGDSVIERITVSGYTVRTSRSLDLTRFLGRPTRPRFGAEVEYAIEPEGSTACAP